MYQFCFTLLFVTKKLSTVFNYKSFQTNFTFFQIITLIQNFLKHYIGVFPYLGIPTSFQTAPSSD